MKTMAASPPESTNSLAGQGLTPSLWDLPDLWSAVDRPSFCSPTASSCPCCKVMTTLVAPCPNYSISQSFSLISSSYILSTRSCTVIPRTHRKWCKRLKPSTVTYSQHLKKSCVYIHTVLAFQKIEAVLFVGKRGQLETILRTPNQPLKTKIMFYLICGL